MMRALQDALLLLGLAGCVFLGCMIALAILWPYVD